jgi:CubicO group peptidase (beta-lactamase class C family)
MVSKKNFSLSALSLLLLAALLLAGCSSTQPIQAGNLASLTSALDAAVPGMLSSYQVPGASVALVVDGKLAWSQGYGLAQKAGNIQASSDTVYQIASVSKPVTAWGVMRLVEQGKIDLDAPISRYITRWKLPPSPFDPDGVTIRRLLSHSAGLSVHGYPGVSPEKPLPSLEESLSGAYGPAYAVKQISEAGQSYSYSGGGYTLLQLMIEEVTGQSFTDFMQDEVLTPLGMSTSSFDWRADLRPATATGYDRQGQALPNYLFTEKAAAGLYTTAGELAMFGAAALPGSDGESAGRGVLSPSGVAALFTPTIAMPGNSLETYLSGMDAYGLGYFIETLPDGSHWYSHNGGNKGWRSLLVIAPKQRAVLVVLTNSDNGDVVSDEITALWADWLGSGHSRRLQHLEFLATILKGIIAVLLSGFALWLYRFIRQLIQGRRKFKFSPAWKQLLRLLVAALLAGLWIWGGSYLVSLFFPKLTGWMGAAVLLWISALALNAVTVTPGAQPIGQTGRQK